MFKKFHLKLSGWFLFGILIFSWHVLYKIFPDWFITIPSSHKVFIALKELTLNGILLKYSIASLFRVTFGFYLAFMIAIPIGIILGSWLKINEIFFGVFPSEGLRITPFVGPSVFKSLSISSPVITSRFI